VSETGWGTQCMKSKVSGKVNRYFLVHFSAVCFCTTW